MSVAELGLSVDSSKVKQGVVDLDALAAASGKAEQAAEKMGTTATAAMKQAGQGASDVAKGLKDTADAAGGTATKVGEAAKAHEGLSIQGQAAFHSLRGLAEQMAYGVPPTQALASHINQLSFAASGPQGLTGAFSEAIGVLGRLVTPAVGVTAAVVGIGVAAVGAAAHWQSAETDISRTLLGIGGASQATVKSIEGISAAIADTGKMSFGEARDAATAIASLGTVNVKLFEPLLDASHNLSIILGKDVTESARMAGSAIGDLAFGSTDGLLKLNQSLGFLNGTLLENIQNLVASGKAMDAQKLATDAIKQSSAGADQTIGFFGKSWETIKGTVSNVVAAVGAGMTDITGIGETLQDQYDKAAAKLKELQHLSSKSGSGGGLLGSAIEKQRDEVAKLKQALDDAASSKFNKEQDRLGLVARQTADSVATEYKQVRDLQTALANINKGPQSKSGDLTEQATALQRINTELRNRTNADGSIMTIEQRQTGIYEAQLAAVSAIGASEKEAATAAMARAQAAGTATDAELAAERAVTLERAQINTAYENSLELLQAQADVAGAVTEADRLDAQEQANIIQLLQQGLSLEQATALAAQERSNAESAASAGVERQTKSMNDQADLIRAQLNGTERKVIAEQAYENALDAGADSVAAREASEAAINLYQAKQEQQLARIAQQEQAATFAADQRAEAYMKMNNMTAMEYDLAQSTDNYSPDNSGKPIGSIQILPISSGASSPKSDQLTAIIDKALSSGLGLGGAAQSILDLYSGKGPAGFLMPKGLDDNAVQALSQITQLMTSNGDSQGAASFLRSELSNLQQQPETFARDQLISQLNDQLKQLTDATNKNTQATVGLDSIYSGGHSALAIGYYGEGESTYNYDPNGFFQGGRNYTAPSQPYDPNAGLQAGPSSGGPGTGTAVNPSSYPSLSYSDLIGALGFGRTPGSPIDSYGIPHMADGGVIEPHTLAYVGEHGPHPRFIRAGDEPIQVTPYDVPEGMGSDLQLGTAGSAGRSPYTGTVVEPRLYPPPSVSPSAGPSSADMSSPSVYDGMGPGGIKDYNGRKVAFFADGGVIEPYSMAYVGEHGPNPKMIQAGAEPIMVTPGDVPTTRGTKTAQTVVNNFVFNTRQNSLGDRRTRRQMADGYGNTFRALQ